MGHGQERNPPATGPALMEQLIQLRAAFDALAIEARDHWDAEERRFELTDTFIDPALNLDGLLKQVFSMLKREHEAVQTLEREMRRLTTAIELAISTGPLGIDALDRPKINGEWTTERGQRKAS